MAEAGFSDDGKYYSAITQDGRLRIWDTETNVLKQEYTPDLHLTSPPSCLQWICVSSSNAPQKVGKRKSILSETESQCVALGTTSGKILIYSIAQAKVETVLLDSINTEVRRKCVATIDWSRKYGLFSCNKDNVVYEWDINGAAVKNKYNLNIESKSKSGSIVGTIKIVPHNQKTPARYLVTASWQIQLWRLHNSEATVIKNLGFNAHPKALLTLASQNNTCWLIEGSQNERLLSLWDVTITDDHTPQVNGDDTPNKKKRRKSVSKEVVTVSTPVYNFVLEDAPRMIDVDVRQDDAGCTLGLAAATRSGVVHYYSHVFNGSSSKPIKPSITIQVTTGDARPLPLQCCRLSPPGDIILGYTNGPAHLFERVTPDLKSKTQVLIRGNAKEPKKRSKHANVLTKVISDQNSEEVTYVEPMGGVSRKRPTPGGKIEVPMEARLANLSLDIKSRSKAAVNQNLTKLLMQALHSRDKNLILTVLQKDDPGVALQTVSNLPADYVPQLLEQLADMAARKTSQCASVCTWLSAVLRCHSALLLATVNSKSSNNITQLLVIFTNRRSHLCQLLNLKGRLELTMAQQQSSEHIQESQEPVLQYNDTSSDSEMEVEEYHSDESHEWSDQPSENEHSAASDDD